MARLVQNLRIAIDHGYYIVHEDGSLYFSIWKRGNLIEQIEDHDQRIGTRRIIESLEDIGHLIKIAEERTRNVE